MSCTSSPTSSSVAVSLRQAEKRGIRIIGTNHFMPENMIEHTLLPKPAGLAGARSSGTTAAKTFRLAEA